MSAAGAAMKLFDSQDLEPFRAPYAPADAAVVKALLQEAKTDPVVEKLIDQRARGYIEDMRSVQVGLGGVEDFMREFGLTTREGLAMMVLAEALLRVPDSATADKLIEDKLAAARFDDPSGQKSDTWLVSASSWALGVTSRLLHPGDTPQSILSSLVKRMGMPTVRMATRKAMRLLGHQFVLGETIQKAMERAKTQEKKGYRYSYDMLGEGARTEEDAQRYFRSYADAIEAIGKAAGSADLPDRPGISVKLSALHPRYEAVNGERVRDELLPRLRDLVQMAKDRNLNFTIDAEEADRLEISLDVIAALLADPVTEGWDGFGLAVQAYQKRGTQVIDWLVDAARKTKRKLMVRLVKGAYWDTEIKHAQEGGASGYPVFTRKAATDLSYICCARRMLDARDVLYPQFATHNALTVAQIIEMAEGSAEGYEFQRLHGMGESLYKSVTDRDGYACRIYAPVGGHKDLLAYLVRRLLENGANSSFVTIVGDAGVPTEALLKRPRDILDQGRHAVNRSIPLPQDLYGDQRRNSDGVEFGCAAERTDLTQSMAKTQAPFTKAGPLGKGLEADGETHPVFSPIDGTTQVGTVVLASEAAAQQAVENAKKGFEAWSRRPVQDRAAALEKAADLLEANTGRLMQILSMEAGKCLTDGIAEIREAVDFCRYYANEARTHFGEGQLMPGPTGEENRYRYRGRGVFVCISPWNFPLAIYLGQISAALLAGNAVVAKPAEQTPLIAYETAKLLYEAGVPEDAFYMVPGEGDIGAALTSHPGIAGVAFTGSTETAWAINRTLAAKRGPIVPLVAETGGINAMLVDATALPEQVCDDVMMSAFRSAGQRCSALRLLYVQDDVADHLLKMLSGAAKELALGDPRLPSTDIGPVIDEEARDGIVSHIDDMKGSQTLRFAGETPAGALANGYWVAPHIIELDHAGALTREVFGPVLHLVRYKAREIDTVLDQIASTGYGLTLGVHSRIDATVKKVVDRLSVGNVYVNRNTIGAVVGTQPFGGSGLSGTGPKAGGPAYLTRFALEQVVSINTAAAGGNASLVAASDD
ncbi:bifunctional proline dehydrogenase/L-glutamate gamma-semialdehyde dehydrogenase PutA [Roseibium denhamense]|uniref:Bifunctional protein PutA n=1 Tax=Roseibium denhamense TaxID=76305 RepID=A0ABY1NZM5_9HYPH|nr:bifunctional proline dehydrogenase/L-glutamate gamma-semialdehyde dehydrogenase PutA [Roseibium denhamense]MTI05118.1 bifunctional proline dehydrogenase/L-glutamate gamma-semialdehyde dehydrogenase PutA [Roseibium denhamense]SMP22792.1 L-proline dehydrogenase /delta-1-pyrroline-5-carboxylate dehydrogenase [Roseibium denhamense]